MIAVQQALEEILSMCRPSGTEIVSISEAAGRILGADVVATREQPPFVTSAMDGYAVRQSDAMPNNLLEVIGESAAGDPFAGEMRPGAAVRIFTGAKLPEGAARVIMQEDVSAFAGRIRIKEDIDPGPFVRNAGTDFKPGTTVRAPCKLTPSTISLVAAMNESRIHVHRKPDVAILPTGNELQMPGEQPLANCIVASSAFGLKAMLDSAGARARILPIARDATESMESSIRLGLPADMLITVGGASVGDHDIVRRTATRLGMKVAFHGVAMRPGKPILAGNLDDAILVGLPGNPVSTMVCGMLFLVPAVRAMLGLAKEALPRSRAPLVSDVGKNGPREHYMRAAFVKHDEPLSGLRIFRRQDSSLISVLEASDALVVRPPHDSARRAGEIVEFHELKITR